jgi:hypothetical protein
MHRIIISVEAVTMRATKAVLPLYGASSFFRSSQSQANRVRVAGKLCAIVLTLKVL